MSSTRRHSTRLGRVPCIRVRLCLSSVVSAKSRTQCVLSGSAADNSRLLPRPDQGVLPCARGLRQESSICCCGNMLLRRRWSQATQRSEYAEKWLPETREWCLALARQGLPMGAWNPPVESDHPKLLKHLTFKEISGEFAALLCEDSKRFYSTPSTR